MTKNQRLLVLGCLTVLLGVLIAHPVTHASVSEPVGLILYSSLFLLSFTTLLLEHFFGRPTDVLAASVSILLLVVPSRELLRPWGIWYDVFVVYEALGLTMATIALLLLTETQGPQSFRNRISGVLKLVTIGLFNGKAQYFWLFFFTLVHFVEPASVPFISLSAYAALVLFFKPDRLAEALSRQAATESREAGEILGVQGRNDFLVRLHPRGTRPAVDVGDLLELRYGMDDSSASRKGIALERFFLDQAQWVRVHCNSQIDSEVAESQTVGKPRLGAVYRLSSAESTDYFKNLIGVVETGTDVQTLRFLQVGSNWVEAGDLLQLKVKGRGVVYQVVNARVDVEALERKNVADFVVGEAVQLGSWNAKSGQFDTFGWVPPARTPVSRTPDVLPPQLTSSEIQLGLIPRSTFPVLLDKNVAISHHTAVLGVTGVGKSVFARELVRQFAVDDDVRIIVVDFTREWDAKLVPGGLVPIFTEQEKGPLEKAIGVLATQAAEFSNKRDPNLIAAQKKILFDGFSAAISSFLQSDKSTAVFELPDVANTELALEFTQWFFKTLFRMARDDGCYSRRVCIVLEEAHTVVPEWNFLGIADKASQSLVNSIGQIALQGRKYGIGFLVIAQRTASVSKTLLTQCNTIIAFQCFDRTSTDFLANYLPPAVVKTLPNLPSRRAIAVGKAIRGSVPLIFDVPNIAEPSGGLDDQPNSRPEGDRQAD